MSLYVLFIFDLHFHNYCCLQLKVRKELLREILFPIHLILSAKLGLFHVVNFITCGLVSKPVFFLCVEACRPI